MKKFLSIFIIMLLIFGSLATVFAMERQDARNTLGCCANNCTVFKDSDTQMEALTPSCSLRVGWDISHHWWYCPIHPTMTWMSITCRFGISPNPRSTHNWYHPTPGARARCSTIGCNVIGPLDAPICVE